MLALLLFLLTVGTILLFTEANGICVNYGMCVCVSVCAKNKIGRVFLRD